MAPSECLDWARAVQAALESCDMATSDGAPTTAAREVTRLIDELEMLARRGSVGATAVAWIRSANPLLRQWIAFANEQGRGADAHAYEAIVAIREML